MEAILHGSSEKQTVASDSGHINGCHGNGKKMKDKKFDMKQKNNNSGYRSGWTESGYLQNHPFLQRLTLICQSEQTILNILDWSIISENITPRHVD